MTNVTQQRVTSLWTGCNTPVISERMKPDDTLDACGLLCPLPVLKLRKRLKSMNIGAVIAMQADDPAAVIDVPHFCAESGNELISATDADGVQTYLIRKTA